jgi:hypothetical protein
MNKAMTRILFSGIFALVALGGALGLEFVGEDVPSWLVAVIAAAAGYVFGHAQENGINGKKPKS